MKTIQNDRLRTSPNSYIIVLFSLILMSFAVSSCTAIAGIFKAGMGFGIFSVLAVLVIIVFIIMRLRQK